VCTPAGWAGETRFGYSWPDAEAKARAALAFVRGRAAEEGIEVEEWCEEYFGAGAYFPADEPAGWEPPEVVGRLAWRTADRESASRVGRDSGVLGLSGPPTITGTGRGRGGAPTELLAVEPFAVDRSMVDAQVRVDLTTI
jgi:hypothetical protein